MTVPSAAGVCSSVSDRVITALAVVAKRMASTQLNTPFSTNVPLISCVLSPCRARLLLLPLSLWLPCRPL